MRYFLNNFWAAFLDDFLPFILIVSGIITVMSLGVAGAYAAIDPHACRGTWQDSGYHYKWSFWGGCMVSADGVHYMPEDRVARVAIITEVSQ